MRLWLETYRFAIAASTSSLRRYSNVIAGRQMPSNRARSHSVLLREWRCTAVARDECSVFHAIKQAAR